jgi:SAM-dependent methyltransferase
VGLSNPRLFQKYLAKIVRRSRPPIESAYQTDWSAERVYWRNRFAQTLHTNYGLKMNPLEDDDDAVPSLELVDAIQDEHKAQKDVFIATGFRTVHTHLAELRDHGFDPLRFQRILEMGVGLGRLIRHYLPFPAELHGCDVTESVLAFVVQTLASKITTIRNSFDPPLPYDDETFDFVYANSVFTHIRLSETPAWIEELHRVVVPNGCVIVSVFNPDVHLTHLSPRDFDRLVVSEGSYEWGRDDTVREKYTFMNNELLFETWGRHFEVLELHRNFKELDNLVLRRPS